MKARRAWLLLFGLLLAVASCKSEPRAASEPLKVAAASDLTNAFKEVGDAFERKTGQKATFTFGSTGLLAKQILEGAPFDVFAAANVSFVDDLVKNGAAVGDTKALYARGRIVAWTKKGTAPPASLADLTDARFAKIGIANPEHAPYGKAAQQALTKAGVWDTVKPKIVFAENIQQTFQFAQTGNVEVAIIALSVAIGADGSYLTIDDALHEPIDQALVVTSQTKQPEAARSFAAFVTSDEGKTIMRRYGFVLPGEAAAAPSGAASH